jgi:RNA polymerase sigma-70 factor, ECF subfamily
MVDMADPEQNPSDQQRFAVWVQEHGRAVRGFLLGMLRQPDLADELCQEVFCRAWQARSRYREEGHTRAYLLQIADRLACDARRRGGRQVHLDDAGWRRVEPLDSAAPPHHAAAMSEDVQALTAALEELTPQQRRVLLLRYYGQFSFAEIAEMTACPLSTTLSHCHRGLQTLRKLLVEKVA